MHRLRISNSTLFAGAMKVLLIGLACFGATAYADTAVSVAGADAGGTAIAGLGAGFNLSQAYANANISAHLVNGGGPGYVSQGTAYLMSSIGPGTTTTQQVNSVDFSLPPEYDGVFTLFSGLSLPAGAYWIVFSTPQSPFSYANWVMSNPAMVTTEQGVIYIGDEVASGGLAAYPPASVFELQNPTGLEYQFAVTGDPLTPVLSVTGAETGGTGIAGLGAGFALSQEYSNVSISAHLVNGGGPGYVSQGTVYLMSAIGSGTTTAQQVSSANFSVPPEYDGMFTVLSGLSLPAGSYWIVFSTPQSPVSYANWVESNPATVSTPGGDTYLGDAVVLGSLAAYPPASAFTYLSSEGSQYQFAVTALPPNPVLSVTGAESGSSGAGGVGTGFALSQAYSAVNISAHLANGGGPGYISQGTAYLMSAIGPGTTTAQQVSVANFSLPPQYDGLFTLFSGLSLPAGSYWIVFSTPQSPFSYANWIISYPATVNTAGGAGYLGVVDAPGGLAAYPPASAFTDLGIPGYDYQFAVTGNPPGPVATVVLTSSSNPSLPGSPVTFTASVSPASASDVIQFLDGTTGLGTVQLANGSAQFSTSSLTPGTHTIQAVFAGDGDVAGPSSAIVTQNVQAATSVALASSLSPSAFGQSVTFSASVTPGTVTGTIQFLDGSTVLGTVAAANGAATLALSTLSVGAHSITAIYSGDGNDSASTSAAVAETVTTAPVVMTMTSSSNPATAYQPVTLTATVSPATATGTVQFVQYNPPFVGIWGTVTLTNGTAAFTVPSLSPGTYNLGANYSGDANFQSLSWGMTLVVKPAPPSSVTLTSSLDPASLGQAVTFTAVVSPGTATGTVGFMDGSTSLGTVTINGGTAALSVSTLSIGAHLITAAYSGDANDAPGTSTSLLEAINKTVSSVGLVSSANPSTFGQSVTLTAFVGPASATGSIQFMDASTLTSLGTVTISGGSAALSLSTLTAGRHSIGAIYSGDANDAGSNSVLLTQTVNQVVSSVALASSANPSTLGQSVTLSAVVTPSAATGGVQFLDGSTVLGAAAVSGGAATLSLSSLSVGPHSITAVYSGDANDATSTSAVLSQTVNKLVSNMALTSSANPSTYGQSGGFTAAVSPVTATGTVQFLDGSTVLGAVTISGGVATLSFSTLSAGAHSITAVYSGDTSDATSISAVLTQTVNKATSSVALTSSANPSTFGQTLAFTATVSPSTATGTVQFLDGATALGTVTITGGTAALSLSVLSVGAHSLTAVCSGDANYLPSTSAPVTQTVNKIVSSAAVTSSLNPSIYNQTIALTAQVTPTSANGTVQFLDGSTLLGAAPVSEGLAVLTLGSLSVGAHSITAVYSGDANDAPSTSPVFSQTVNMAQSSVALISSANPSTVGYNVDFTVFITPGPSTGTIQFRDGATALGTATVVSGWARLSLSTLSVGVHSITAVYSGDANDAASTSAILSQTVNKAVSSVTLASSLNPSTFGQSVTLSAAVTPSTATGTVQFLDGSAALGTVTISNGSAALSLSNLSAGAHSITAVYSGDANDNSSTSNAVAETVQKIATTTTFTGWGTRALLGTSIAFTVAVTPAAASGTVNLMKGTTILGTSTLSNGTASFNISTLPAGSTTIYAQYVGNASYLTSSSATLAIVVLLPCTTVLTTTPNPSVYGAPVTLTLTATPAAATGPVQFVNGSITLGTANLVNGQARLTVSNLPVGSNPLTADYSGDATYIGFTSLVVTQAVNKAPTTVALASSKNPAASGQSVTFTATVSPNSATGTVQFLDGSTALGTVTISGGTAALSISTLSVGSHSIKAVYSGDSNYLTSTSTVLTESITGAACHVTYAVTNQWNNGFGTAVTIQNTGTTSVNGWNLTWTWAGNQKITEAWDSTYSQSGANAKLVNASYNAAIAPGATITGIGFNASYSGTNTAPTAFSLNGTLCK